MYFSSSYKFSVVRCECCLDTHFENSWNFSRSLLHRHLLSQHGIDPSDLLEHQKLTENLEGKVGFTIKSEDMNDEDQDHHMLAESMLESETVSVPFWLSPRKS